MIYTTCIAFFYMWVYWHWLWVLKCRTSHTVNMKNCNTKNCNTMGYHTVLHHFHTFLHARWNVPLCLVHNLLLSLKHYLLQNRLFSGVSNTRLWTSSCSLYCCDAINGNSSISFLLLSSSLSLLSQGDPNPSLNLFGHFYPGGGVLGR